MTDAAPVRYRAVAAGVVRTNAALDSAKATPANLTVGQELLVTEVREVEGTVRLKFDGGWTSQTAKSGKLLVEKLDASDDDSGSESGSDAGSDSSSESYSGSDSESGSGSDSDAGGGAEGTRYRALAPGVIRTGAALDSPKAEPDKLTIGEEILVTNQQIVDGSTRLQFDRGWTSETAKSGKVLLERTDPEPDKEKQANRAGESLGFDAVETWRAVAPGVVRTGAALDSPKAELDTLKVGQVIKVTEQKVVNGTVRLHFARGWTSEKARSGKVLLERVEAQSLNSETTDGDLEHLEKELEAEEPDALDQLAAALESDDSQQESEPEPQLEPEPEPEQSPDEDWLVGDDSDEVSIFDDPAPEQDLQRAQPLTVEDFQPGLAVEIISDQWRGCSTGITLKKAGKKAHVQFDDGEKQWVPFAELQRKGDMSTAKPKSEPDTNDGCKPKDHALVDSAAQAETEKAQRAPDLQPTQRSEAVPGVGTRPSQDQSSVLVHSEAADTDEESDTEGGDIRTAAAEEDEKIKAEEQAAADAEQAAKDRKTKERAEKRRNMSKEDKMAKMKLRPVQKKAETMKQENRLADPARYEEALAFIEDEQWVKAEAALKDAMFDVKADETKKTDQNDTEQEEEEVAAATTAAVQAKQAAERAAAQQRAAAEVVAKDATEAEEPTRAQPQPAGEAQDQVVGIKAKLQAGEAAWANERAELQVEIVRLKAAEAQRDAHAADWTSERDSLRAEIAQLKKAAEIQRDATAQRAAAAVTEKVAMEESEKLLLLDIEALRNAHNEQMAEAAKQYESKLELLGSENSAKLIEEQEKNALLEKRLDALEKRRIMLTEVVRKTQGMMGHMRKELQWLASEKEKVVSAAQVELEKDREKHRNELAKVLTREQDLLAAALVQPRRASSRTATRGSPRRRKAATTTPGRKPQVVRK